jgi:hypothetical protein
MAGGVAQAYYRRIADHVVMAARRILDEDLLAIVDEFNSRYGL